MSERYEYGYNGPLGIIALKSCYEMGQKVNEILLRKHRENPEFAHNGSLPGSYLVPVDEIRFTNGEGKVKLEDSVRGKDIFVICDIGNYSCTYKLHGFVNHMGPDEHFQDLKRTLSAIGGKSRRTTVIMPLMYASRQDKRKSRESLDCAMALQELERMGVENIMTFDVHNSAVQNAIPLVSFENLYTTCDIVTAFYNDNKQLFQSEGKNLLVISPDTGATDRAVYYANIMNVEMGLFYKRRNYNVINGKNPIVAHEYIGQGVAGQNVLIVDDMIGSGDSVLDVIRALSERKAKKIFVATSFALFTEGIKGFKELYEKGCLERVYTTNLSYIDESTKKEPWFREVDMSGFMAKLVDYLHYSRSLAPLLDATTMLKKQLP